MTVLAHTRAQLAGARERLAGPVALVPTMGALHAGHLAHIEQVRPFSESVVVSIFVNPMQFGPAEDLAVYPRTLEQDLELCERAGVDVVWAPSVEDVYPAGEAQVSVDPGPLGRDLEGVQRPTHFAGVLTVVAKLVNLIRPAVATFGEKDYQQLALVTRMVGDLDLGVGIVPVPIVREPDGLARSSRNCYLNAGERARALVLSRALFAGRAAADRGADAALGAARAELDGEPQVAVDYLALRAPDLGPAPQHGPARLLVAARVGRTRLIDNVAVQL